MRGRSDVPGQEPATFYALLGVPREASAQAIVHAFRRAARSSHPDAQPGDPKAPARFRMLATAYDVLSDPERRAAYDRTLDRRPPPSGPQLGRRAVDLPVAHPARLWTSQLWAGPVRVEPAVAEPPGQPGRSPHMRRHETEDLGAFLLRLLTWGWSW
jgi:curved DNA-binding protein CbpA